MNTRENLLFLRPDAGGCRGQTPKVAVATTSYHLFRVRCCWRVSLGLKCWGAGLVRR